AEMAHRLEAALRRPAKGDDGRAAAAGRAAADEYNEPAPAAPPARPAPAAEAARPARTEARPARAADAKPAPQKALYDSLEGERACLWGGPSRPCGQRGSPAAFVSRRWWAV